MNSYTAAQLAEIHRQELTADATYYRRAVTPHRPGPEPRAPGPVPVSYAATPAGGIVQSDAAEPHATAERKREVRTEAVKKARQSPLFSGH